jgi:hypothetical protein
LDPTHPSEISRPKPGALFVPDVEKSLRESKFAKSCAGKKVTLVFNFVMGERLLPKEIRFSFGPPNQFWIAAGTPPLQP